MTEAATNLLNFVTNYVGGDAADSLYPEIAKARQVLDAARNGGEK